jgi:metal-sulfur cluster biosynthetic enzyme
LRISRGIVRWTADFTSPTSEYDTSTGQTYDADFTAALTISDALAIAYETGATVSAQFTVDDSSYAIFTVVNVTLVEEISIADDVRYPDTYDATFTSALTINDAPIGDSAREEIEITESFEVSSVLDVRWTIECLVAEDITLDDVAVEFVDVSVWIVDDLTIGDAITGGIVFDSTLTEAMSVNETWSRVLHIFGSLDSYAPRSEIVGLGSGNLDEDSSNFELSAYGMVGIIGSLSEYSPKSRLSASGTAAITGSLNEYNPRCSIVSTTLIAITGSLSEYAPKCEIAIKTKRGITNSDVLQYERGY